MAQRAKLDGIAKDLGITSVKRKTTKKADPNDPNPKRGERGDFLKITATIPPDMLADLKMLGLKRRAAGQRNTDTSSLIREAVADLLKKGV